MKMEEFANLILLNIENKIDNNLEVKIKNKVRNDGSIMIGISVEFENGIDEPCIYLDSFYESYQNNKITISQATEEIFLSIIERKLVNSEFGIDKIMEWENVKNKIFIRLANTEKNVSKLSIMPHREFHDLTAFFYIRIAEKKYELKTIDVKNDLLHMWGKDVDDLLENALNNVKTCNDIRFTNILSVIPSEMTEDLDVEGVPEMYVLSNRSMVYGAGVIVDPKVLEMISQIMNSSLILLPSSVHEVLVLADKNINTNYEFFSSMVKDANALYVRENEILSNHVYRYDIVKRRLDIIC